MEGTTATPSAPTTSAPSAPPVSSTPVSGATATPTASPTPAERPTFAQAFANDAAAHKADPATPPEGATTPPVEGTTTDSATPPSTEPGPTGPVPVPVHVKALENARVKAVEEFRRTSGVDKAVEFANKINANPSGFLAEYARELLSNPQTAAATKAELARMFGGLRQPKTAPPVDLTPDVQILDNDGRVVGMTLSAEKQKALIEQAVAPFKQESEQRKADAAAAKAKADAAKAQAQLDKRTDDTLAEVKDTLEITAETPKEQQDALILAVSQLVRDNPGMSAHRAALQVRQSHVLPARAGQAQAQVLKDLQTKANAQAVNPAGAVVAATVRPKSFLDPSLKW